jgi:hypothetical protein
MDSTLQDRGVQFVEAMAPSQMTLVCRKCTRIASFGADRLKNAIAKAIAKGWVKDGENYICPKCPAVRV